MRMSDSVRVLKDGLYEQQCKAGGEQGDDKRLYEELDDQILPLGADGFADADFAGAFLRAGGGGDARSQGDKGLERVVIPAGGGFPDPVIGQYRIAEGDDVIERPCRMVRPR